MGVGAVAVAMALHDSIGAPLVNARSTVEAVMFSALGARNLALETIEARWALAVLVVRRVGPSQAGISVTERTKTKPAVSTVAALQVAIRDGALQELTVRTVVVRSATARTVGGVLKVILTVAAVDAEHTPV